MLKRCTPYGETVSFKRLLTPVAMAFTTVAASAGYVDPTTGREWAQLSDTAGTSWSQIAAACSFSSGACSGMINGKDVAGWKWASDADIRGLLNNFGAAWTSGSSFTQVGSTWAPAFLDTDGGGPDAGAFSITHAYLDGSSSYFQLTGWARGENPMNSSSGVLSYVRDLSASTNADEAGYQFIAKNTFRPDAGAWLFREVANSNVLPEPGTLALVGLGILGMVSIRKRRQA